MESTVGCSHANGMCEITRPTHKTVSNSACNGSDVLIDCAAGMLLVVGLFPECERKEFH